MTRIPCRLRHWLCGDGGQYGESRRAENAKTGDAFVSCYLYIAGRSILSYQAGEEIRQEPRHPISRRQDLSQTLIELTGGCVHINSQRRIRIVWIYNSHAGKEGAVRRNLAENLRLLQCRDQREGSDEYALRRI